MSGDEFDLNAGWVDDEDYQLFIKECRLSGYKVEEAGFPEAETTQIWDAHSWVAIAGYPDQTWKVHCLNRDMRSFVSAEEALDYAENALKGRLEDE